MLLVDGMPKLLSALSIIGTAAMLWVGGHILLVGAHELGWHTPYDLVHDAEHWVEDVPGIGAVLAWTINTAISAIVGLAVGRLVVAVVSRVRHARGDAGRQTLDRPTGSGRTRRSPEPRPRASVHRSFVVTGDGRRTRHQR